MFRQKYMVGCLPQRKPPYSTSKETGPQHCNLWELNPQRGESLWLYAKLANHWTTKDLWWTLKFKPLFIKFVNVSWTSEDQTKFKQKRSTFDQIFGSVQIIANFGNILCDKSKTDEMFDFSSLSDPCFVNIYHICWLT